MTPRQIEASLAVVSDLRESWQIAWTGRELEEGRRRAKEARAENERLLRAFRERMGQSHPP